MSLSSIRRQAAVIGQPTTERKLKKPFKAGKIPIGSKYPNAPVIVPGSPGRLPNAVCRYGSMPVAAMVHSMK